VSRYVAAAACLASAILSAQIQQLVQRDAYLMGTRASLSTYAGTRDAGLATLERAVRVLEDTEQELSTWRRDSSISVLNRHPIGSPWTADPRLCRMFVGVFAWHTATGGAFDPGVGQILQAWDIHGEGRIPTPEVLQRARASSGLSLLVMDKATCTLTRLGDVIVDVGAFGKGEALDRAAAALGPTPWMIDLGGQVSVGAPMPGGQPWRIAIAHPLHRDRPQMQVRMTEGSLSTSAGSERDLVVNGRRVSHHIDPHTGEPATFGGSVTVWHRSGLSADALSTALYVMGPAAGLGWAEAHDVTACYLIPNGDSVDVVMTRSFKKLIDS
jgi:thiamine biosynthesis lipoprotein